MERCIYKHMYNYLISHNLIYANQSRFLTGQSTAYHNTNTCVVFCDISKAFGRIWQSGLLAKIRQLDIRGNLLTWIDNYLSNRQQQVRIGQSHSRSNEISVVVPQGSVLGP